MNAFLISHQANVMKTQMLGPEAFQAPIANTMLETYRSMIVCVAGRYTGFNSNLMFHRQPDISLKESAAFSKTLSGKQYLGYYQQATNR